MDKSIQEKTIGEDANEKGIGSCNRSKGRVCRRKMYLLLRGEREEVREFV